MRAFSKIEHVLGMKLPNGYRQIIRLYGYGLWQDSWCIASPFAKDQTGHPRAWHIPRYGITLGPEHCATLREWKQQDPELLPWPVYPSPGGLFSWAATDNAGTLYWLTEGDPESWPILHEPHEARPREWRRFDMPFEEFMYKAIAVEPGGFKVYDQDFWVAGRSGAFRPWPWVATKPK